MILKALQPDRDLTIDYFHEGALHTIIGQYHNLNLADQTLWIKANNQTLVSMPIAGIQNIQ